jgi:hypothetical protein
MTNGVGTGNCILDKSSKVLPIAMWTAENKLSINIIDPVNWGTMTSGTHAIRLLTSVTYEHIHHVTEQWVVTTTKY